MALQFQQPGFIPPSKYGKFAENLGGAIATLPHLWQQYKIAKMQNDLQLKQLEQQIAEYDRRANVQYGTGEALPTAIRELPGMMPTQQESTMGAVPQATPLPEEAQPGLRDIQRSIGTDRFNQLYGLTKPIQEPRSIDGLLADRVNKGELTLEEAMALKTKMMPQTSTFVGTQDGKPVLYNPKTKQFEIGSLPSDAPLMSTTQSEGQANAKLFADRASKADEQINSLGLTADLASVEMGVQGSDLYPNIAKTEEAQLFDQAKRNFVNAILRRESGAVISPAEFENANKQYFPIAGDSPAVMEQKSLNRRMAVAGLQNAAGLRESPAIQAGWSDADEQRLAELEAKLGKR